VEEIRASHSAEPGHIALSPDWYGVIHMSLVRFREISTSTKPQPTLYGRQTIRDAPIMPSTVSSVVLARRPRVRTGCTTCKYVPPNHHARLDRANMCVIGFGKSNVVRRSHSVSGSRSCVFFVMDLLTRTDAPVQGGNATGTPSTQMHIL
jgi:hypothetical protein